MIGMTTKWFWKATCGEVDGRLSAPRAQCSGYPVSHDDFSRLRDNICQHGELGGDRGCPIAGQQASSVRGSGV